MCVTWVKRILLSSMGWAVLSGTGAWGKTELTLDSYLQQVKNQHDGYRSAEESKKAAELYQFESDLTYAPTLIAKVEKTNDKKPGTMFAYDGLFSNNYQLGFSQTTSLGLSGKLYYNVQNSGYRNLRIGGPASSPSFLQVAPTLEFTLPLWRNLLGKETRAIVRQGEATRAANILSSSYQLKSLLQNAEVTYWQLALARESTRVYQDAVQRDRQLVEWHRARSSTGLADRADLLQSEAALQSALLTLKTYQDSELAAARSFNLVRGKNEDEVLEELMPLTPSRIQHLKVPQRERTREDILAAAEDLRSSTAGSEASRQKYLPTLELYGTFALNNPQPTDLQGGYEAALQLGYPTRTIGVRLSAPLDFGLIHSSREGYAKAQAAADLQYQRKLLEEQSSWHDLNTKYQQAQDRYALYQQLEEKQHEKLEYERHRRAAGRTTTQQVLNFENDYQNAQLGRIQTLSDLLQIRSQMKLYGAD